MSLDRFKKIKTRKIDISTDPDYSAYLTSLPESSPLQARLRMLGTVAAVVVALVAVMLWALIGRGMRGNSPIVAGDENAEAEIYNAIQADIFSDSNVKRAEFTIDDVTKVDDTLYFCSVSMDIEFYDEQNITYPLNQTNEFYHNIFPLYIEHENGVYSVSDNQDRKLSVTKIEGTEFEWELDKGMLELINTLFANYDVLSLPLWDDDHPLTDEQIIAYCSYVAQKKGETDINKVAYDCFGLETSYKTESNNKSERRSYIAPEFVSYIQYDTVYSQWYIEITYAVEDKVYVLGFVYRGDGNIERFVFHKEDKLFYEGSKGIGALTEKMLRNDPFIPYMYTADEVKKALDGQYENILSDILLPQSMGITTPNIDTAKIEPYDAVSILDDPAYADIVSELTQACDHGHSAHTLEDLKNYTYYDYARDQGLHYVNGNNILESLMIKHPEVGEIRSNWTAGMALQYERLYEQKQGYRYYLDSFTEEQLLKLKERGVLPQDIPALLDNLKTAQKVVNASDEKLKEIIEQSYKQKLSDTLGIE